MVIVTKPTFKNNSKFTTMSLMMIFCIARNRKFFLENIGKTNCQDIFMLSEA
jgi:hypothetical protein